VCHFRALWQRSTIVVLAALLWGTVQRTDVSSAQLPKGGEDAGQAITLDEEDRLVKACAASTSRSLLTVVTLALNTGMRHDEMRLLRWRQVDLRNATITVGKSKTDHGAGRAVPLNQRALKVLEDWSREFPDRKPSHYVFPSEKLASVATTKFRSRTTRTLRKQS
jgi:integrase